MDASRPILFRRTKQHPTVAPVNASTGTGVHLDHGDRRGRSTFAEHPTQRDATPFGRFANRIQAFTLHLTDEDRTALGSLYLVAENRYGKDSRQMRKVDDLARKLAQQRQADLDPAPAEEAEEPVAVGAEEKSAAASADITHPPAIPAMAAAAGITTWQLLMQDDTSRESARLLEKQLGIRLVDRQA
ncbi:hypothetical protein [Austwickia chelonae]|uniref:hypothetical protein n=1 Tax=Austwickia chelonae TaxID=100225 RepID=UPI0013C2B5F3|nr:hypothetical protein [Austwickia chelonae]